MPDSDPNLEHSPLGPSSAKRWMNCTGSVDYTADMEDTAGDAAAEGTAAHTLSEWMREEGKPAKKYLGREIEAKGKTFVVGQEMATNVQKFVDYCNNLPGDAFIEERVHYTAWVPNGWGTGDDMRADEEAKVLHVTDLKYGKGVMEHAPHNPQLMLYGLGAFQELGHLYEFDQLHLTIHQPRLDHVSEWWISVKDLLVWARDEVKAASDRIIAKDVEFKAGDWCMFCRGKLQCATRINAADEVLGSEFDDLDAENTIPIYRVVELLKKKDMVFQVFNDLEKRAFSELQQGHQVPGKKLVAGRSTRKWRDEAEAEKALRAARLKVKEIFPPKLISAPQAEKLLGKGHPLLEEQVIKPQGKPVMVDESDPRPPLAADAAEEFDDLE